MSFPGTLRHTAFVFLMAALASCTGPRGELGTEKNPIKLYFIPSVDAKMGDKAKAVKAYLESQTPYKFETAIPQSYVAVVEAFGTKRADIAAINTFGYIMANEKYGAEARIVFIRNGLETYKAQIVTKTDSPIKTLADLNGKKFAYVDPASTSGYLLPAKMFADRGIKPSETVFAKKHDNVITMIYQGQVDAGATFYSPADEQGIQDARRLVKTQYPDVEKQIRIVELTESIPNDPIIFRKDMPEEMKAKIVEAVLSYMQTQEGKAAFKDLYGVTEMKAVQDSAYDGVREMLRTLGKSATDLALKK